MTSVSRIRNGCSVRIHTHATSDEQDGREYPIDPGESDDGVKNAADSLGTETPEEVGPLALSGR